MAQTYPAAPVSPYGIITCCLPDLCSSRDRPCQVRPWITRGHVDDLARVIIGALEWGLDGEIYNSAMSFTLEPFQRSDNPALNPRPMEFDVDGCSTSAFVVEVMVPLVGHLPRPLGAGGASPIPPHIPGWRLFQIRCC